MIITVVLTFPMFARACDICGCGVGNGYIGILPDFHQKIFGFRYRYNSILTHIGVNGARTYLTTTEIYKTAEFWGGYNIGTKFRIMAAVPYSFNERSNQGTKGTKNGLGDITISGYYQLLNSRGAISGNKLLIQSLWIGGGVKLPTGKYNPSDKSATNENTNLFQLGTASTDFTLNAMYDIRLQDAGLNVSSAYKMNTANKYGYKYGNKFSLNSQLYYKFRIKDAVTFAPNAGIQYERGQRDEDKKFQVDISGGNLLLGTAGIEASIKKISFGGNYQTPVSQDLGKGFLRANNRFMMHISLAL